MVNSSKKKLQKMDETHTIAAALPTAEDDDQAEFHGRAARPTAIKLVEDMVPRESSLPRTR